MKEYNREKKIWEKASDKKNSLKKKESCRGGKDHVFELVLPDYIVGRSAVDPNFALVRAYYMWEDARVSFEEERKKDLQSKGLKTNDYFRGAYRYLRCTICQKKAWGDKEKAEKLLTPILRN